jgi:hypothetical protein
MTHTKPHKWVVTEPFSICPTPERNATTNPDGHQWTTCDKEKEKAYRNERKLAVADVYQIRVAWRTLRPFWRWCVMGMERADQYTIDRSRPESGELRVRIEREPGWGLVPG